MTKRVIAAVALLAFSVAAKADPFWLFLRHFWGA